jgi:hypothetical protein
MNPLDYSPTPSPDEAPNILSLEQAMKLAACLRSIKSQSSLEKKKDTAKQRQRACQRCGKMDHAVNDVNDDGVKKVCTLCILTSSFTLTPTKERKKERNPPILLPEKKKN